MKKHSLLATVAALTLFGATGIATAQNQMQGGQAPAAGKQEMAPAAKEPAAKPTQAQTNAPADKGGMKADSKDNKAAPKQAQDKSMDKNDMDKKGMDKKDGKTAEKPASTNDSKSTKADNKSDAKSTTGSAGASAKAAAPPAEKRTQIVSAIKQTKIKEVTNVNFNISIGTRVPRTVEFHAIPSSVIAIYPEWRSYKIILVSGRYIIVEPETYEIVYILEV